MNYVRNLLLCIGLLVLLGACGGGGGGDGSSDAAAGAAEKTAAVQQSYLYSVPGENRTYEITLLGDFGEENWAIAVNDAGQVTGNYHDAAGVHTFFWDRGEMVPLLASAQAADLNEAGQVVGWIEGATPAAFLYDGGTVHLVPDAPFSRAYSVNDAGKVVGHRRIGRDEAFLEDNGRLQRLAEEVEGYATRINDAGQVAVQQLRDGGVGALLLEDGQLTDLGTLGGRDLYVRDLNEAGEVVGWGTTGAGEYHAFIWRDGRLTDLAPAFASTFSAAVAVGDDGTVLVKAMSPEGYRAFLWQDGRTICLETFGAPAAMVTDMNNRGQIVGWLETADGSLRAFIATPKG